MGMNSSFSKRSSCFHPDLPSLHCNHLPHSKSPSNTSTWVPGWLKASSPWLTHRTVLPWALAGMGSWEKAGRGHWLLSGSSYPGTRNKSRTCSSKTIHLACCLALSTSDTHRPPALPAIPLVPPLLEYTMQIKPEKAGKYQATQITREVGLK